MKKTQLAIISIVSFIIILTFTESAFSENSCMIQWWGDKSGFIPTNETSLTEAVAFEAFNAILGFDPVECGSNGLVYVCLDQTFSEFEASGYDDSQTSTVGFFDSYYSYPPGWSEVGPPTLYGEWDVVCKTDTDSDRFFDDVDNCPSISNPNQEDADSDGTGDVCDPDTIYGYITGEVQEGVILNIATYSCGTGETVATITTNDEGYYAVGGLENDSFGIVPYYSNYVFSPKTVIIRVPQTNIRSYNFTATSYFVDNGDGTVTSELTGLMWPKNANLGGEMNWYSAINYSNNLSLGSDDMGTPYTDWRLPDFGEMITHLDVACCDDYVFPFINVEYNYWTSKEGGALNAFYMQFWSGQTYANLIFKSSTFYVWPVRGGN
jgi:hypothetical protein